MFPHNSASIAPICYSLAILLVIFAYFALMWSGRKATRNNHDSRFPFRFPRDKNKETGDKGEFRLWVILENNLNKMVFKILHDIHLPIEGKTTQIDFLVISCWGIFVIEAKTLNASVYGEATDSEWIAYYDTAKPFRNPLLQNQWHIQALSSCLGLDPDPYIKSVVAFAEETTFRAFPPDNVMHFRHVPDYIHSHLGEFCFMAADLPKIVDTILDCDPTITPETRDEHTMNIPLARLMRYCPPTHARTYS